jgi:hypothetical protein
MRTFLDNPYVIPLQATQEVAITSSRLQFRFDTKRMPELREKAIAAGVPKDNANKLKRADADVLATARVYKAARLTTYDPFLLFIGKEYITPETGLVIDLPDTSWLPFGETVPEKKGTSSTESDIVEKPGRKFRLE